MDFAATIRTGAVRKGAILFALTSAPAIAQPMAEPPTAYVDMAPKDAARRTLADLVATAATSNPNVTAAKAGADAAGAAVSEARWQMLPTPQVALEQRSSGRAAVATLEQPLWSGGRLRSTLRGAKAREKAAEAVVAQTRLELAIQVVDTFQSWLIAAGTADSVERGIDRLLVRQALIGRRVEAGASGDSDQDLVSARLAQAEGDLQSAQARERAALAKLVQLTSLPLTAADIDPDGPLPTIGACPALLEQTLAGHPALSRLGHLVEVSSADVKVQRGLRWPTLAAVGEYRNESDSGKDARAYLTLRFAPGAGLSLFSRIKGAEAGVEQARASLAAARVELAASVQGECESHEASSRLVGELDKARGQIVAVAQSYTRLFVAGRRNWLDVINAEREITAVETSLIQARAQLMASAWRLALLSGQIEGGRL